MRPSSSIVLASIYEHSKNLSRVHLDFGFIAESSHNANMVVSLEFFDVEYYHLHAVYIIKETSSGIAMNPKSRTLCKVTTWRLSVFWLPSLYL